MPFNDGKVVGMIVIGPLEGDPLEVVRN